jgi:hypothetical protein
MKNLSFLVAVFITLIFASCTDEGTAPVINLTSPTDNQVVVAGQVFQVKGTITDDQGIKSIRLSSNLGINETITTFDSATKHELNYNITTDANTPANTYDFEVIATDDQQLTTSKKVRLKITR